MWLVGYALAAVLGVLLGLLGGGGSILAIPILVYLLGFTAKQAIASSMVIVGATSVVGATLHARAGRLDVRAALPFVVGATLGTSAGAFLGRRASDVLQLTVFAAAMLGSAVWMLRGGVRATGAEGPRASWWRVLLLAVPVGVLTGFSGVGGGFLIVPALTLLVGLPIHRAVGTSLAVIAVNAAVGLASYLGAVELPWTYLAGFTGVSIVGSFAGARLAPRIRAEALRRAFALFLLALGAFVLVQTRLR